jgi:hypothetical protein
VQLYAADANGDVINPAAGVQVSINGVTYTTDSNGRVSVQGQPRTYTVQIQQTYFNNGWARYTFWKWSDGSTSNPRSFTVSQDTAVTAYVYDERKLYVTYGSGGYVKVNGQQVSSGWEGWFRYGSSVTLEAVPYSGYDLQKWQRAVDGGSLTDYSVRIKEELSGSASSTYYARVDRTTSNAFTGYVEVTMTYTAYSYWSGYFYWCAGIYTPSRTLSEAWGEQNVYSQRLSWSGTLSGERVTFTVYGLALPSYSYVYVSLSGTVVKPADNPVTAYMTSGWWYNAVFGSP